MVQAVDGVTFVLDQQQALAVLGESGCGKSSSPAPSCGSCRVASRLRRGVRVHGLDVMAFDEERFRREVRWSKSSIVMQAAMNALNPVLRVADRVIEPLLVHQGLQREAALARVHDVFQMVGVPLDLQGDTRSSSAAACDSVVLAMALVLNPHSCYWTSPRRRWTF